MASLLRLPPSTESSPGPGSSAPPAPGGSQPTTGLLDALKIAAPAAAVVLGAGKYGGSMLKLLQRYHPERFQQLSKSRLPFIFKEQTERGVGGYADPGYTPGADEVRRLAEKYAPRGQGGQMMKGDPFVAVTVSDNNAKGVHDVIQGRFPSVPDVKPHTVFHEAEHAGGIANMVKPDIPLAGDDAALGALWMPYLSSAEGIRAIRKTLEEQPSIYEFMARYLHPGVANRYHFNTFGTNNPGPHGAFGEALIESRARRLATQIPRELGGYSTQELRGVPQGWEPGGRAYNAVREWADKALADPRFTQLPDLPLYRDLIPRWQQRASYDVMQSYINRIRESAAAAAKSASGE